MVLFKDQSRYTMLFISKQAEKRFKIYSLCHDNYMINFTFSSWAFKINGLNQLPRFINSFAIIAQIRQFLPNYRESQQYLVNIDNFFTNVKFFKYLGKHGIKANGTVTSDWRFLTELLIFYNILSKKNHWGFLQTIKMGDKNFSIIWQDLNNMQLMTICYSLEKIHQRQYISGLKRNGIPTDAHIIVSISSSTF